MSKDRREYNRAYYQKHKEYHKAYRESHKDNYNEYQKSYRESHKDRHNDYLRNDVNSLGVPKNYIRTKSIYYLKKHGTVITGYEIHHCFTYDEPYKFIYCSKEKHLEIHQYLRDEGIKADTYHYEQIKHLLDDTVVVYGL